MKDEMYGIQEFKRGFVPIAEASMKVPICGPQKLQFYQKLFYFYT
jgi:hypothetical protein